MAIAGLAREVSGYAMAIVLVALDAQRRDGHHRGRAEHHHAARAATAGDERLPPDLVAEAVIRPGPRPAAW